MADWLFDQDPFDSTPFNTQIPTIEVGLINLYFKNTQEQLFEFGAME